MKLSSSYQDFMLLVCTICLLYAKNVYSESNSMQDPTKPPFEVLSRMPANGIPTAQRPLTLNGLKKSGTQSVAIVNNTFIKVGDIFQGYRFIGVKDEQAIFEDEGHQRLILKPDIVDYRKFDSIKPVSKKRQKKMFSSKAKE